MDYSNIKVFSLMKTKMAYLAENQDILAQNIANSDTPGYKVKKLRDLDFEKLALAEARRLKMRAVPGAAIGNSRPTPEFRQETQRKTYETTPVENTVALEEQMAKMAYNNADYSTMTNLYSKTASMFKMAIGDK